MLEIKKCYSRESKLVDMDYKFSRMVTETKIITVCEYKENSCEWAKRKTYTIKSTYFDGELFYKSFSGYDYINKTMSYISTFYCKNMLTDKKYSFTQY